MEHQTILENCFPTRLNNLLLKFFAIVLVIQPCSAHAQAVIEHETTPPNKKVISNYVDMSPGFYDGDLVALEKRLLDGDEIVALSRGIEDDPTILKLFDHDQVLRDMWAAKGNVSFERDGNKRWLVLAPKGTSASVTAETITDAGEAVIQFDTEASTVDNNRMLQIIVDGKLIDSIPVIAPGIQRHTIRLTDQKSGASRVEFQAVGQSSVRIGRFRYEPRKS